MATLLKNFLNFTYCVSFIIGCLSDLAYSSDMPEETLSISKKAFPVSSKSVDPVLPQEIFVNHILPHLYEPSDYARFMTSCKVFNAFAQIFFKKEEKEYSDNPSSFFSERQWRLGGFVFNNYSQYSQSKKNNYKYISSLSKEASIQLIQSAADQKQAGAMAQLGFMHCLGYEVEKDPHYGFEMLLLPAAEQGHPRAQYRVGRIYLGEESITPRDIEKAIEWNTKAAQQSHTSAMLFQGYFYGNSLGKVIDADQAADWHYKAAEKAYTHNIIGEAINGLHTLNTVKALFLRAKIADNSSNKFLALQLYEQAYRQGHPEVLEILKEKEQHDSDYKCLYGELLLEASKYQDKNGLEAIKDAAQQSSLKAKYILGHMYEEGLGILKNLDEALSLYESAAKSGFADAKQAIYEIAGSGKDQGNPKALFILGKLSLAEGNSRNATNWFQRSADQGNIEACQELGIFYFNGQGVSKSPLMAKKYLEIAANTNLPKARYFLARLYLEGGRGVQKDISKALELLKSTAQEHSHVESLSLLVEIYAEGRYEQQIDMEQAEFYENKLLSLENQLQKSDSQKLTNVDTDIISTPSLISNIPKTANVPNSFNHSLNQSTSNINLYEVDELGQAKNITNQPYSTNLTIDFLKELSQEINLLYTEISEIIDGKSKKFSNIVDIYFKRDEIVDSLRENLIKQSFKNPRLLTFPLLDINTFNSCIFALNNKYYQDNGRPDVLLHLWSYLSGIKVLRLKHKSDYYYNNKHFLPDYHGDKVPTLFFDANEICAHIEEEGDTVPGTSSHQDYPVPKNLLLSSLFYRTNFGSSKLSHPREVSIFIQEFFGKEIEPLIQPGKSLSGANQFSSEELQTRALLNCVLRLKQDTPCYSLGLIKLFQNTAIYLSLEQGSSRLVTGPCSIASISYLGLQDGIFVEKTTPESATENVIDYLFGLQFYNRGLFEHFELKEDLENPLETAHYYPTYLTKIKADEKLGPQLEILKSSESNPREFGRCFRSYIQNKLEPLDEPYNVIKQLIKEIDSCQLRTPLKQQDPSERVWFEPDYSVDLSGDTMLKKFSNYISDDVGFIVNSTPQGTLPLTVSNLIKHFYYFTYQVINKIDLSNNNIGDEGAIKIAAALEDNILLGLEELNLSSNGISNDALNKFQPLLLRDNFKYLILYFNNIKSNLSDSFNHPSLLRKIIWIPENWLKELKITDQITDEIEQNHKKFYKSH